jgi:hypothetical protein
MRIFGYLTHPSLKITVFKTDTRLSIKFENGTFEQTFKFRPTAQTSKLNELQQLVDETLVAQVQERFRSMEKDFAAAFQRNFPAQDDDDFPDII